MEGLDVNFLNIEVRHKLYLCLSGTLNFIQINSTSL